MDYIGIGIACGLSVLGAAFGNALVVSTAMKSMTRQPEMEGKLRTTMILGMGFIDGVAIISIVIALLLALKQTAS